MPIHLSKFVCSLPPEVTVELCPPRRQPAAAPRAHAALGPRTAQPRPAPESVAVPASVAGPTTTEASDARPRSASPRPPASPAGPAEPAAAASGGIGGIGPDVRRHVIAQLARKSLFSLREASATGRLLGSAIQDVMKPLDGPLGAGDVPLWKRAVAEVHRHLEATIRARPHETGAEFVALLTFLSPDQVNGLLPRAGHWHYLPPDLADMQVAASIMTLAPHLDAAGDAAVEHLVGETAAMRTPSLRAQSILDLVRSPAALSAAQLNRLVAASPVRLPAPGPDAAGGPAESTRAVFTSTLARHLDPIRNIMESVERGQAMTKDGWSRGLFKVSRASSESDVTGLVDTLVAMPDYDDDGTAWRDPLLSIFADRAGGMAPTVFAHHAADIDRAVRACMAHGDAVGVMGDVGNLAERIPSVTIGGVLDAAEQGLRFHRPEALQTLDVAIGHMTPAQVQQHQPEIARAVDMWLETSALAPPTHPRQSCVNAMGRLDASRYDGLVAKLSAERAARVGRLDSGGIGSLLLNMHRLTDTQFEQLADIVAPAQGAPDIESLKRLPDALGRMSFTQFRQRKDSILRMVAALETAAAAPGGGMTMLLPYALSVAALVEMRMSALAEDR